LAPELDLDAIYFYPATRIRVVQSRDLLAASLQQCSSLAIKDIIRSPLK
jgi:hypothetical protein